MCGWATNYTKYFTYKIKGGISRLKKIFIILTLCILSITGCSKKDNRSFEKYIEQGKAAVASQDYEKALNFFTLAKEENENDEDVKSLYNQTKNLVEAIDSKEKKNYTVAIQLCEVISKMKSDTNIIKEAAEKVKKESNELMGKVKDKEEEKEKDKKEQSNDNPAANKKSQKQYYLARLSQVESKTAVLENSPQQTTMDMRRVMGQCYTKWDDLLNEIYGVLKTELSESQMSNLKNKQRNWIKYRDSEADKAAAEYEGGTMAPLEHTAKKSELTRQRCYELVNNYLN